MPSGIPRIVWLLWLALAGPAVAAVVIDFEVLSLSAVPEPSTWALLAVGGVVLLVARETRARFTSILNATVSASVAARGVASLPRAVVPDVTKANFPI